MTSLARTILLSLGVLLSTQARALTPDEVDAAKSFMLNNSVYVLYHEIGHLFVGEFELPVLGKEEDAADNLATLLLLAEDNEASADALTDAANGWYLSEYSDEATSYENADFYDNHSLDIQRSFAIVCLMVGSDAQKFGPIADEFELDKDRQAGCSEDFAQAVNSWDSLLKRNERQDKAGKSIKVVYESGGEDYEMVVAELKKNRFLELAASMVTDSYVLPRKVQFTGKLCDEANAYYDPSSGEIIFCYELADYFFGLMSKSFELEDGDETVAEEADEEEYEDTDEDAYEDAGADEEDDAITRIRNKLSGSAE
ncbi:MAG: DUF4344 domain-containing metallopeptidase [Pseudomonadota bacterium]